MKEDLCPIDIALLQDHVNPDFNEIITLLRNKDNCTRICYDWDEVEEQCIDLVKVYDFFKSINQSVSITAQVGGSQKFNTDVMKAVVTTTAKSVFYMTQKKMAEAKVNIESRTYSKLQDEKFIKDKVPDGGDMLSTTEAEQIIHNDPISTKDEVIKQLDNNQGITEIQENFQTENKLHNVNLENLPSKRGNSHDVKPPTNKLNEAIGVGKLRTETDHDYDQTNVNNENSIQSHQSNPLSNLDKTEASTGDTVTTDIDADVNDKQQLIKGDSFQRLSNKNEIYSGEGFFQTEESHFFIYFLMITSLIIMGYLAFHNKNKILAYALEGRSDRHRRRPNPAKYRKLESNLEEAIASNPTHSSAPSIVY
ncbi:hypothetical protein RUM44_008913 [Polyplax serrata]|uniref:Uncharacterized protein n=1 Tax=Polyplax serrata TaxID=468196 RepID=A0ABR1AR68_POLSC